MLKKDELLEPSSCLNRASAEEPIFVLRANDPLAAQTVRLWAAMSTGRSSEEKVAQALQEAERMEEWNRAQPKEALAQPTGHGKMSGRFTTNRDNY